MKAQVDTLDILAEGGSRRGPVHAKNEDAWYISDSALNDTATAGRLFAVSDGVSTARNGWFASRLTCDRLDQFLAEGPPGDTSHLVAWVSEIDWELRGNVERAACTLSMLWIADRKASIVGVGDSSVWRLRRGEMVRLIGKPNATKRLSAFLGMGSKVTDLLEVSQIPVKEGDVFFLMTDGISSMVESTEIVSIWKRFKDPAEVVSGLLGCVARGGGEDDATVVVVEIGGGAQTAVVSALPVDAPEPPKHLIFSDEME